MLINNSADDATLCIVILINGFIMSAAAGGV